MASRGRPPSGKWRRAVGSLLTTVSGRSKNKGGVGILTVGNFGAQATRLVISILVAQLLGPAGRGAVALISVLDEVSSAVFTIGIPIAAGFHAKLRLNPDQNLINSGGLIGVFLLPITVGTGMLVGQLALGVLEPIARWITVLLIAWTGIVNLPGMVAMNILQAHRELRKLAVYRVTFGTVTMLVVLAVAVAGELSVAWVAAAFAIGRIATGVYGLSATKWPSYRAPIAKLMPLVRYGITAVPGSVGTLLNNRLDQLLIAPLVSLGDLGLYAVAAGTSFPPTTVAMSMGAGAFATVTNDAQLGRKGSTSTAIRRGILVSAIASAGLAAVSPVLIPILYGPAFKGAVMPTIILLAGSVAWGGQLVACQCANALGHPSFASISESIGLFVTIVGLIIFVPPYGIIGASVVSLVAYITRLLVTLFLLRRVGVRHFVPGWDDVLWLFQRVVRGSMRFRRLL
jgi:O-antigen/teichoic acid export membrane protein